MSQLTPYRKHALCACGIAVVVTAALAVLCGDVVRQFFPYAEEWKIMLPSLPGLADPVKWFLGFASVAADPYPPWAVSAINFWRPVMHIVYWLRGMLFGDTWGAYLYVNFAAIGIVAGALYLCLRLLKHGPDTEGHATATGPLLAVVLVSAFIAMPPLVSATSRFLPLIVPQFPFGRLLAALCLLAALSFVYRRYWLAALLVAVALTTKEQAAPMAIALPLTYAWFSRRDLRRAWPTLLLLAAPLLAWIGLRLVLFGSLSQGVYVLLNEPASIAHTIIVGLLKLPLYAPSLSGALHDPLSLSALLVACNLVVLAYLAVEVPKRWWTHGPDVVSVAFIGYWLFLAIVGLNPRYGTLIIALAILMLARRPAAGVLVPGRVLALAALIVAGLVQCLWSVRAYPVHVAFSKIIYQVGQDYAAALGNPPPGTKMVVVLNDPNTVYTAPAAMAKTLRMPVTKVFKTSDYPWPWPQPHATTLPQQPCTVTVTRPAQNTVALAQSCGLLAAGALPASPQQPLALPITEHVKAVYPQARKNEAGYMELGRRLVLTIRQPGVAVLYFDPSDRSFHWVGPITATQGTQQ